MPYRIAPGSPSLTDSGVPIHVDCPSCPVAWALVISGHSPLTSSHSHHPSSQRPKGRPWKGGMPLPVCFCCPPLWQKPWCFVHLGSGGSKLHVQIRLSLQRHQLSGETTVISLEAQNPALWSPCSAYGDTAPVGSPPGMPELQWCVSSNKHLLGSVHSLGAGGSFLMFWPPRYLRSFPFSVPKCLINDCFISDFPCLNNWGLLVSFLDPEWCQHWPI